MWSNISEASSAIQKGFTFYLAILVAITGYILSADTSNETKNAIFLIIVLISVIASICVAVVGWGVWIGLKEVAEVAKSASEDCSHDIYYGFISRARKIGLFTALCLFIVLVIVLYGLSLAKL